MGCLFAIAGPAAAFDGSQGRAGDSLPRGFVMDMARSAFRCAKARGEITKDVLTIIDYSLPSFARRLWVVDMTTGEMLNRELVAHGRNSGGQFADRFSNEPGSRQSSLGLFRADETYQGRHGYSLRLTGLEPGVNDNARERAIVVHGADYVSADFIKRHGRLGRSWGCPSLRNEVAREVIDEIKNGGALYVYHPARSGLVASPYLSNDCIASR